VPIYEYECGFCQCRFEKRQRFDEEPIAMCPQCQEEARRVIRSVPIIFKGSGFYTTDSRQSEAKAPVKAKKKSPVKGKET